MARRRFQVFNGATAGLTSPLSAVTTGTSLKTMLQIKPTTPIAIIAWGYSFTTVPTTLVQVELVTTGTAAATVTNYAAGDIIKYDDASGSASSISTGGGNTSGFTATGEGTITSTRLLAARAETGPSYESQFPLDREPAVIAGDVLRLRALTTVAINMLCWVTWEE
ncbi:hypothetical protein [Nocardia otitidiscaviarum]|uniref:hypothetical protein n=1 Tax=Nocardia otitidiscaviarum TaxID=1823 RepID=UPI0004A78016|nr:hypothetical protein [Nocardia otitidiscaviarum]